MISPGSTPTQATTRTYGNHPVVSPRIIPTSRYLLFLMDGKKTRIHTAAKGVFKFWEGRPHSDPFKDDFEEQPNSWVDKDYGGGKTWEWGYNHPIAHYRGDGVANSRDEAIAAAEQHHQRVHHTEQGNPAVFDYQVPFGASGLHTSTKDIK